jgi:hypothetical protein
MFGSRIPLSEINPKDHDVFERFSLKQQVKDYLINSSSTGLSSYLSDLPGEIDFQGHSLSSTFSKTKPDLNIDDIISIFTVDQVDPNQIPIPDPIKQNVNVPMGLVDPNSTLNSTVTTCKIPKTESSNTSNTLGAAGGEKKIILRLGIKKDSKRKSLDESEIQPLKKLKDV